MDFISRLLAVKKPNQKQLANICLGLIAASMTIMAAESVFFKRIELVTLDTFFRLRMVPPKPSPDIIMIEINNDDVRAVGRWPWQRRYLAKMANALKDMGADQIFFDFLLSSPSDDQEDDDLLQEAIKNSGKVYLPSFLTQGREGIKETLKPIDGFMRHMKEMGFVNIVPDIDGSVRRLPLYVRAQDNMYYSVVLHLAKDRLGGEVKPPGLKDLVLANASREIHVPLVDGRSLLLNWYGTWDTTFKRYSYLDIVRAHDALLDGRNPEVDIRPIKGKICIVALSAIGLYDIKAVPVEAEYPGSGLLATALSNILNQDFMVEVALGWNVLLVYLVALIPVWLIKKESPGKEVWALMTTVGVVLALYFLFLNGYQMNFSAPLIALGGSYMLITTYNFISPAIFKKKIAVHRENEARLEKRNKELSARLKAVVAQREDLRKVNRELDRFVNTVSHDIRSPLLCLLGYAGLLQERIEDNLELQDKRMLDGIFKSIDHLNEMVDSLLRTTKKDRIDSPYEETDLNALIKMIEARLEFNIQESHTVLDVQENLPCIVCDRIKIGEVFHNLIVNAIKFSAQKTDQPRIEIRYFDTEDGHQIMVKDNGIGIDPQYYKKAFEMFKQVNPSEGKQGWGVGLSIVQNVIADHGGRVWVESEKGQGAAFFFTVPKDLKSKTA